LQGEVLMPSMHNRLFTEDTTLVPWPTTPLCYHAEA